MFPPIVSIYLAFELGEAIGWPAEFPVSSHGSNPLWHGMNRFQFLRESVSEIAKGAISLALTWQLFAWLLSASVISWLWLIYGWADLSDDPTLLGWLASYALPGAAIAALSTLIARRTLPWLSFVLVPLGFIFPHVFVVAVFLVGCSLGNCL